MLRNADLHTADQIAVLVRIGHALACDAHFRAAGRAGRHFEGDFVSVDIRGRHFRAVHGLADGDGQRHDDVTSAQGEFRVFGDGDMQVQIAVFAAIAARSPLPLVADIHFDYRLAIAAAEGGAAKIRINPGNIGGEAHVRAVADCCRAHHIPIRIGVNGGSLEKSLLEKYGHPTPEALVESAFSHIRMLEDVGFGDICVSMKSSNVPLMMQAYRLMHERSDYPLHVGVTETGTEYMGTIKSAMGIGGLLCLGIGDTIRVSLTADPVREVVAAKAILKAAGLRKQGVNLISCPTCGRTKIDLIGLANRVQEALQDCDKELTVAVMGCVVNGPGEAREADIGIAGGDGCGVLFVHGELKEKLPYDELLPALLRYIDAM